MLDILKQQFITREQKVLQLISEYESKYNMTWPIIGIFGSYARGEAKGTSDIDICIIANKPDAYISGPLREDADMLGADIVFLTKEQLLSGESLLIRNIRRDIKFIRGGEIFEKQLL